MGERVVMQAQLNTNLILAVWMSGLSAYDRGQRQVWEGLGLPERILAWLSTLPNSKVLEYLAGCDRMVTLKVNESGMVNRRTHMEKQWFLGDKQEALIRFDAPVGLLTRLFGLSAADCAEFRKKRNIPPRTGRPSGLTEEQQHTLWRVWNDNNRQDPVDRVLAIGRADVPLSSAWQLLSAWMDQEDADREASRPG